MWDGTATGAIQLSPEQLAKLNVAHLSRQQLDAKSDRATFWLGDSFAGYNVQVPYSHTDPEVSSVVVPYGVCTMPGSGGERNECGWKYAVIIGNYTNCYPRPESLQGKVETMRGGAVVVQEKDQEISIWTGDVMIKIHTIFDMTRGKEALRALRGIGQISGHIGPDDPLPPPDFSRCP